MTVQGTNGESATTIFPVAAFFDADSGYTVGQTFTLLPVVIDPGGNTGTVQQYTVAWGDGSATETDPGTATSFTHVYASEASNGYTATVTASGSDGTYTDKPVINEAAPTLSLSGNGSATEEGTCTLTASIADGDTGENYTWEIDWGDGSETQTLTAPAGPFTYVYSEAGTYTVSALVSETDDAAGQGDLASATVSVSETTPTESFSPNTASVAESTALTVTDTFSDPGADPLDNLTVVWGDGNTDAYNGDPRTFAHAYAEAGTYSATAMFATEDGLYSATTTITATEVTPSFSIAVSTAPLAVGVPCTFSAAFGDAGSGDTPTNYTIAWGDGHSDSIGTNPDYQGLYTHTYTEASPAGGYTVGATATTGDGAYTATTTASVAEAGADLTLSGLDGAVSGQPYSLVAFYTDPGGDQPTYTVDWNDGTTLTTTSPTLTHAYGSNFDGYAMAPTVTVSTDDTPAAAGASYTLGVDEPGGAGIISSSAGTSTTEGQAYNLLAYFTDSAQGSFGFPAGATWTVCWGDGQVTGPRFGINNPATYVSLEHTFAESGTYAVTIGAEYEDDSESNNPTYTYQTTLVKNVVVADVTPTVSVRGNTTATVVGDAYTLLPAFTDAGSGDTPRQWTVAWGDGSSSAYFGDIGNVSHVYTSANATSGTVYSPSLTVITDDGTYSASTSVTIGQPVMNVIQGDGTPMNHDDQHDMGAFIVINNDDDLGNYDSNGNPIPDLSYTTPQSYADPDLVQVTLQPLPSAVGGTYTLSWDTNDFRVWTDPYKDSQLTSGATFSATAGHSVYLEAIAAPLGNSDILEEDWHGGPGGALAVAMVDHAKLKTLTVSGPQNVPAYGTYSYSVSGGVPHNKANSWKVTDGVTTGTSALDSKTLVQWTKANAGTAGWVGKADFIIAEKAANYEVHAMSPNVVNISIAAPPGGEFSAGTPTDGGTFVKGNLRRKQVWSGDQTATPKQPGLAWGAVVTLNGPNNNTGVDRIKVGFIQNITGFIHHGTYKAGNQFITARSKVEGATLTPPGLDEVDGAQRPWYSTAAGNTFQPARGGNPTGPISSSDMPFDGPPLSWTAGRLAGQLMHMNLQYSFALYIAAQSQDAAGSKVYVGQYKGNWVFNGDGTIKNDQGWTWTKDGTAKVTPPTDWGQQLTTGESPVISGETLNSFLHVEPFQ